MITHATPTGWQLIYQRAHALLAGQIALHWRVDQRPKRWMETLAAITQHDDGGREWEGADLLTPAGAPKDFKLGEITLEQPTEAILHAQYQGQYVALLQSMHSCQLYKDFDIPGIKTFLKEQVKEQTRWREALGISEDEARSCYDLLYWCDAFSLILCQRQLPSDGRKIEVGPGPDGTLYFARREALTGGSDPRAGGEYMALTVEPWPFDEEAFQVGIEATTVEGLTFKSDEELVKAMRAGKIEPLVWHFRREMA